MKKLLFCCGILIHFHAALFSQNFTNSNLPIVVLSTGGQQIDSAKYFDVVVWMGIIDNGPGNRNYLGNDYNAYNGYISLNLHGSSTMNLPKKSYKISTLNADKQNINVSLLGMPAENDWILEAIYQDKSLIRNELTYSVHRQMGHWSSRYKFVELVVDGEYKGIYGIAEKIKKDKSRVNISKLKPTEISGDFVTGGYIFMLDHYMLPLDTGWFSNYNTNFSQDSAMYFLYKYPKPGSMPFEQKEYLKNYVNHIEWILANDWYANPDSGYTKYIDVKSFVDNFIINELSRNIDGYRLSSYFYKDRDSKGGKLTAGPVWDYNIAYANCWHSFANVPQGWQYQQFYFENWVPFWWWQFMTDPFFQSALKCRYTELRKDILSEAKIFQHIDSLAIVLEESQQRNFTRWPIMGEVIPPAPSPAQGSFAGEIGYLKSWISQRLAWLDANLPGACIININENETPNAAVNSYPNPFTGNFHVMYELHHNAKVKIELVNLLGEKILDIEQSEKSAGKYIEDLASADIASGVYILKFTAGKNVITRKVVKGGE